MDCPSRSRMDRIFCASSILRVKSLSKEIRMKPDKSALEHFVLGVRIDNTGLLGLVSQNSQLPPSMLMLMGAGNLSPLRCLCNRSNWSMAR